MLLANFVEDFAYAVIQISEHRRKDTALDIVDVGESLHVLVRALKRTVNGIIRQIQEEGFVRVAVDEVNGFAREGVGQVFVLDNGLPASNDRIVRVVGGFIVSHVRRIDQPIAQPTSLAASGNCPPPQHRGHTVIGRRDEVVAFMQKAEEFIKALAMRMEIGGAAKMPLADQASRITLFVKQLGERRFFFWQAGTWIFISSPDWIELVPESCRNPSGQEAGSRGTAIRRGDITLREARAIGCY